VATHAAFSKRMTSLAIRRECFRIGPKARRRLGKAWEILPVLSPTGNLEWSCAPGDPDAPQRRRTFLPIITESYNITTGAFQSVFGSPSDSARWRGGGGFWGCERVSGSGKGAGMDVLGRDDWRKRGHRGVARTPQTGVFVVTPIFGALSGVRGYPRKI